MEGPRGNIIKRVDDESSSQKKRSTYLSGQALRAILFKSSTAEAYDLTIQQEAALLYARGYSSPTGERLTEDPEGVRLSTKEIARRILPSHVYGNTAEEHELAEAVVRIMAELVMPPEIYEDIAARRRNRRALNEMSPEEYQRAYAKFHKETLESLLGIDLTATHQFFDRPSDEIYHDLVAREGREVRRIVVGSNTEYTIVDAQRYNKKNMSGQFSRLDVRRIPPGFVVRYKDAPVIVTPGQEIIAVRGVKSSASARKISGVSHVTAAWDLASRQRLVVHDKAAVGNDNLHLIRRPARKRHTNDEATQ